MGKNKQNIYALGFTIVELLVVVVVIGILAGTAIVLYSGAKTKAIDLQLSSDVQKMNIAALRYAENNGGSVKAYYSGNGSDSEIDFSPASGDIIDVVSDSADYCIRAYNTSSTNNSPYNAVTKESSPGMCDTLGPSAQAIADYENKAVWSQVVSGTSYSCGVDVNGAPYCWGWNNFGQVGNNSLVNTSVPTAIVDTNNVLSGKTIKSISVGGFHTCAIASDNWVYCWGRNTYGQLGINSTTDSYVPVAVVDANNVLSGKTFKSIAVGYYHTCAIASDDKAYCWGSNSYGQVGDGFTTQRNAPVAVNFSGKTVKSITSGQNHTCAVASDSQAYCWGLNQFGGLGDNTTTNRSTPTALVDANSVLTGKTIKSISAGHFHTCVIASDNQVYCWGYNTTGGLGDTTSLQSNVPVAVTNTGVLAGKTIRTIKSSQSDTCVLASDYQSYCWGANAYGAHGKGSTGQSRVPVATLSPGS